MKAVPNQVNSDTVDQQLKSLWKEERNKPHPRHHDTDGIANEQQEQNNFEPVFDFDD